MVNETILETTSWRCDTCGGPIERPEDGVLEFVALREANPYEARSPRIVHAAHASRRSRGCQYDPKVLARDGASSATSRSGSSRGLTATCSCSK